MSSIWSLFSESCAENCEENPINGVCCDKHTSDKQSTRDGDSLSSGSLVSVQSLVSEQNLNEEEEFPPETRSPHADSFFDNISDIRKIVESISEKIGVKAFPNSTQKLQGNCGCNKNYSSHKNCGCNKINKMILIMSSVSLALNLAIFLTIIRGSKL